MRLPRVEIPEGVSVRYGAMTQCVTGHPMTTRTVPFCEWGGNLYQVEHGQPATHWVRAWDCRGMRLVEIDFGTLLCQG